MGELSSLSPAGRLEFAYRFSIFTCRDAEYALKPWGSIGRGGKEDAGSLVVGMDGAGLW